ncbi:hypothetical protein MKW98_024868, partial [Papaver atlanticum]
KQRSCLTLPSPQQKLSVRNAGHSVSAIPFYANEDLPVAPQLTCNASQIFRISTYKEIQPAA